MKYSSVFQRIVCDKTIKFITHLYTIFYFSGEKPRFGSCHGLLLVQAAMVVLSVNLKGVILKIFLGVPVISGLAYPPLPRCNVQ